MQFIDLNRQYKILEQQIDQRIKKVLQHSQFILGPEVNELEQLLAKFTKVKHCLTVASGTDALLIAMMALDIQPGDEIITTAFTFFATVETMMLLGAIPKFIDIDPHTYLIDVNQIERAITPRTKAIMPISLYGQVPDMEAINAIAQKYHLAVIEDGAQSFGATQRDGLSCGLSTLGCTSFFPTKPLACYGDGGAIFTNDDQLAQRITNYEFMVKVNDISILPWESMAVLIPFRRLCYWKNLRSLKKKLLKEIASLLIILNF